jgi:hypothetical protein
MFIIASAAHAPKIKHIKIPEAFLLRVSNIYKHIENEIAFDKLPEKNRDRLG